MRILAASLILAVPFAAHAGGKLKATFTCSQKLKDGSLFKLETKGAWRISGTELQCVAESKDHKLLEGRGVVKTAWHKGGEAHEGREHSGSPIGEAPYQYIFTLERGVDWDECASDVTVPLTVFDVNGGVRLQTKLVYKQDCAPVPVAPAVGAATPAKSGTAAAGASAAWEEGARDQIPPDARPLAEQFIAAVVDSDPPTLASLAGAGVKVGKKTIKGDDLKKTGLQALTGIKESVCGDGSSPCTWGKWQVLAKGASEFWLYSNSDSGYGTFKCAVFTNKGGAWAWTAVKSYDTGEP